jgi:hypothetical protein
MALRIERYGNTRHWAVYDEHELVVVTLYKRGAQEVLRRLAAQPPARVEAAAQAAAVEAAARQAQELAAQACALAQQAQAAARAAQARTRPSGHSRPPRPLGRATAPGWPPRPAGVPRQRGRAEVRRAVFPAAPAASPERGRTAEDCLAGTVVL